MRLDKYLKVSRLIKRRTLAQEACDAGRIKVNDKAQKSAYSVKIGDIISIGYGDKGVTIEVVDMREHTKKEDAALMYKVISE